MDFDSSELDSSLDRILNEADIDSSDIYEVDKECAESIFLLIDQSRIIGFDVPEEMDVLKTLTSPGEVYEKFVDLLLDYDACQVSEKASSSISAFDSLIDARLYASCDSPEGFFATHSRDKAVATIFASNAYPVKEKLKFLSLTNSFLGGSYIQPIVLPVSLSESLQISVINEFAQQVFLKEELAIQEETHNNSVVRGVTINIEEALREQFGEYDDLWQMAQVILYSALDCLRSESELQSGTPDRQPIEPIDINEYLSDQCHKLKVDPIFFADIITVNLGLLKSMNFKVK